jgi:hypothetical protein
MLYFNNIGGLKMNIRRYLITVFLVVHGLILHAQKMETIEDYNAMYNHYSSCNEKKSTVSPWLINGAFVEKGYGYIGLPVANDSVNTIPFIYYKGRVIFCDDDYEMVTAYERAFCHESTGYDSLKAVIHMNCIGELDDTIKVNTYLSSFPLEWILCCYDDNNMASRIYRVTEDSKGNYVVSLDTYGYYLSYNIVGEKDVNRVKHSLLKKHKKIYGRL